MFKQHMLPSAQLVGRLAKLVGNPQHRSVAAAVLNAGIAISRHTKPQIKRPGTFDRKSQVRRHHDVAAIRRHLHLDRAAIERQHQRLNTCPRLCPLSDAVRWSSTPAPFRPGSALSLPCDPSLSPLCCQPAPRGRSSPPARRQPLCPARRPCRSAAASAPSQSRQPGTRTARIAGREHHSRYV